MKKRQILWAIVFGSMLAITGCGDDASSDNGGAGTPGSGGSAGSSGAAGSAGSGGGDFCTTLCGVCGEGTEAQCKQACDSIAGMIPGQLDKCPNELNALTSCYETNGCDGDGCEAEQTAWATCVFLP